jgi:hypothetical protein
MRTGLPPPAARWRLAPGVSSLALLCALATPAAAETGGKQPTLVQADRLAYDQNTGTITATGRVEVSQGDQVLRADGIVYDQTRDVVHAEGHVAVMQPTGDVLFADKAEMTGDMKQGFVDRVGILFSDNSRLAARDARRYEGRYLIADRGVYSACDLCRDDPERPPLWQVKAAHVTHDNVKKDVIYRDALFLPPRSNRDPAAGLYVAKRRLQRNAGGLRPRSLLLRHRPQQRRGLEPHLQRHGQGAGRGRVAASPCQRRHAMERQLHPRRPHG